METVNIMVPMATVLNGIAEHPAMAITMTAFALVLGAIVLIREVLLND